MIDEVTTVLHSLPTVRPTTNPYLVMLREGLRSRSDLRLLDFSYRTALTGRYQVFHVHWPEILLGSPRSPVKRVVRQLLLVMFLVRLMICRIPIVRTVHNIEPPEDLSRHEYWLLRWIDRLTTLRIQLNERTPGVVGQPSVLIPHGHYREWFADCARPASVGGRFGYAGLIRRYKGVENLLKAFHDVPEALDGSEVSLRVGGRPSSPELIELVESLGAADGRIELQLEFLTEADFADILSSSELVVLPYRFMHNSGGALASLSLDRPVLVPDNEVNRDLAAEVGVGWVHTFSGDLGAADLRRSLAAAREPRAERPDLSGREWDACAEAHASAYRRAILLRRGSSRRQTVTGRSDL